MGYPARLAFGESGGRESYRRSGRDAGDRSEFLLTSLWESWEAIRAFAGQDPSRAVFYDEDDRFLVERELTVTHHEVFAFT